MVCHECGCDCAGDEILMEDGGFSFLKSDDSSLMSLDYDISLIPTAPEHCSIFRSTMLCFPIVLCRVLSFFHSTSSTVLPSTENSA